MDEIFGKWVIPVRVNGAVDFNLLAVWAYPVGTKRADNYVGEVYRCLKLSFCSEDRPSTLDR